jgi:chromosome partitioning protein
MKTRSRKGPNTSSGRIVLVCKLKGGAGATTSVRELAVAAVAEGLKVGVIDLDGQGGLTRWWNRRTKVSEDNRGQPELLQMPAEQIPSRAPALRVAYDLVLIDSPPSVHATISNVASVADLAVIPSRPNVDDLDAVGPVFRLLHGVVDIGFVLTQVPGKRSLDGAEALERLAARGPVLGRTTFRAAYSRPPGAGSTGFESDGTAREEIGGIYALIRERLWSRDNPKPRSGDRVGNESIEATTRPTRRILSLRSEVSMPLSGNDPSTSSGDNPKGRGTA